MRLMMLAAWAAMLVALSACATPATTGAYRVGRTNVALIDPSRPEVVTPEAGDVREVPLILWYPAVAGTGSSTGYFPGLKQVSKTLSQSGDVSKFEVVGMGFVPSRERLNARLSDAQATWPVVLMSPGNGTNVEFYDSIAADLASHGFVVIGLNHPYDAASVMLSTGKPAVHPSDMPFDGALAGWRCGPRTCCSPCKSSSERPATRASSPSNAWTSAASGQWAIRWAALRPRRPATLPRKSVRA